jgi:2-methylcitrate dehydratase PrpD
LITPSRWTLTESSREVARRPRERQVANSCPNHLDFLPADDGTATEKASIDYPLGHRRRRREGIPLLERKFQAALATRYPPSQAGTIRALFTDPEKLEATPVNELLDRLVVC